MGEELLELPDEQPENAAVISAAAVKLARTRDTFLSVGCFINFLRSRYGASDVTPEPTFRKKAPATGQEHRSEEGRHDQYSWP